MCSVTHRYNDAMSHQAGPSRDAAPLYDLTCGARKTALQPFWRHGVAVKEIIATKE